MIEKNECCRLRLYDRYSVSIIRADKINNLFEHILWQFFSIFYKRNAVIRQKQFFKFILTSDMLDYITEGYYYFL